MCPEDDEMGLTYTLLLCLLLAIVYSAAVKVQVTSPLAEASCSPWNSPHVVCINHYSSVMPFHFSRKVSQVYPEDTYGSTSVQTDPSFAAVAAADILVFDQERGLEILGPNPSLDFMFRVAPVNHEGPVFVPDLNKLYVTQMQPGYLPQLVIDLDQSPPSLSYQEAEPPLYLPSGGTFHEGLIYYSCLGGNTTTGQEFRPGIYTLNATSGKSQSLLNNYFGYYFNGCDDLVVDSGGDVWFTDNFYSWGLAADDTAPQIGAATYRFRPSTGAVNIVEDSLQYPNGIALAPGQKTLYLTDTGAGSGSIDPRLPSGQLSYVTTGKRTVYAYDFCSDGMSIVNKRPVYLSQDFVPDGLKIARNGYIVAATGNGVDVLDAVGTLLVRIQTNYTAVNIAWTGQDFETLWIVGAGGISRVNWNLKGQVLT